MALITGSRRAACRVDEADRGHEELRVVLHGTHESRGKRAAVGNALDAIDYGLLLLAGRKNVDCSEWAAKVDGAVAWAAETAWERRKPPKMARTPSMSGQGGLSSVSDSAKKAGGRTDFAFVKTSGPAPSSGRTATRGSMGATEDMSAELRFRERDRERRVDCLL